jgi:hypothetical protein
MAPISEGTSRARPRLSSLGIVLIAGAVGGTLLDQIHVRAHVLHYAHPTFLGQAWWVAPQFGVTVMLVFLAVSEIVRHWDSTESRFLVDAAAFVLAYVVTGALKREPWLALWLLLAIWIMLLAIHRDRARFVLVSMGLAVVGPAYESSLTATGAFRYDVTPLALRVPVWLPALYLIVGVLSVSAAAAMGQRQDSARFEN